jgi:peptide/nickel transport system substrate-binding protein
MVRNPHYWGTRPVLDEVVFLTYSDGETMTQDLKLGVLDAALGLPPALFKTLRGDSRFRTVARNFLEFEAVFFNCKDGPSEGNPVLRDRAFRRALAKAIDRDRLASVAHSGLASPGTTVLQPDTWADPDWHWEPPTDVAYGFDLEMAKQKLDEAGYKDTDGDGVRDYQGKPIDLRLWARSESTISQSVSKLVAGSLKDVGLKVTLQTMDDGALTDQLYATKNDVFNPDYDLFLWGWYSDLDPSPILSYFTTDQINGWSDCAWSNKEYDELYLQQSEAIDPTERKALIDKMQEIIYRESPYIPTVYSNDLEAYNIDKWEGYEASPSKIGNVLFPPYGQAGNENFLLIQPKTAATTADEGGGNTALWVAIGVGVVIVILLLVLVLRRKKPQTEEG